jgi:hypothetical protein
VVVYEAGPLGFTLYRMLKARGVLCYVCAPDSTEQQRKRRKNDKIDARSLTSKLFNYLNWDQGALQLARVPTEAQERLRLASRQHDQLQAERFLFLEQRHGFLQLAPVSQDHGLVAVASLQTVLLGQALAAFPPAPFPIGKQSLQDRGMGRLEFPERRKVLQLLTQQGVQLESLPVAIQHSQQRRIDKPVAGIAPFRLRETGDLHCQRKPESLDRADGHRI